MKRGPVDAVLSVLAIEPYRCRGCRRRFYRFGRLPREREDVTQGEEDIGPDTSGP